MSKQQSLFQQTLSSFATHGVCKQSLKMLDKLIASMVWSNVPKHIRAIAVSKMLDEAHA